MPNTNLSEKNSLPGAGRQKKKANTLIGVLFAVAFVIMAAAVSVILATTAETGILPDTEIEETNTVYDNIYINGIDVSGLTKEEALVKVLSEVSDKELDKTIDLVYGDKSYSYKLSDFGATYDIDAAVNTAYDYARQGDNKTKKAAISALETKSYEIEAMYNYDKSIIEGVLKNIENEINIEPVNATMERVSGKFEITNEQPGVVMRFNETLQKVVELVTANKGGILPIEVDESLPRYTAESFNNATKLIGTFSTSITGSAANRNKNLDTAASKINDYIVYPDEVFSTNASFGEMTEQNGYTMAPVIVGGELTNGMGGGVCQVSSTLYMALLYAEVQIVERQNHSQKVGYADWGYDATLAGDYIDLKFKNDTEHPITIESYIDGQKLVVNLYGYEVHDDGRRLEFYNALVETVPAPETQRIDDDTLPLGEEVTKTTAKNGQKYNLYKIVYENGVEVSREQMNLSYYRPKAAVVLVGTGLNVATGEGSAEDDGVPAVTGIQANVQPTPVPIETPLPQPTPDLSRDPAAQVTRPPDVNTEPPLVIIDTPDATQAPPIIG